MLVDTLSDIVVWTKAWTAAKGSLYLREIGWIASDMRLEIFKIGRLQYCMSNAKADVEKYGIKKGDGIIEMHIPACESLTPDACKESIAKAKEFFKKLASASEVELVDSYADTSAVQIITDSATAYIPLADMIDFDAERKRLQGELAKNEGEIKRLEGKLSNAGFVAKAPAAVVEGERAKLAKYHEVRKGLEEALAKLQ